MPSKENEELVNSFKLIGELLNELLKTKKVSVPVTGALTDATTVGITTFVGSMAGGKRGAVAGAFAGLAILAVSKVVGYCRYKPLMTVIMEELTEEEKKDLYEKVKEILNNFGSGINYYVNQLKDSTVTDSVVMDSAVKDLKKIFENNPEAIETITRELQKMLAQKNMSLAETN